MMTTLFLSQTLAFLPNLSWKMPMVPGPQTSWVMRTSTSTQIFSPGRTAAFLACLAMIFSVRVMGGLEGMGAPFGVHFCRWESIGQKWGGMHAIESVRGPVWG